MQGNIIKKRYMSFAFKKTPHISLSCKLVPVQTREYETGLLPAIFQLFSSYPPSEYFWQVSSLNMQAEEMTSGRGEMFI